MLLLMSGKFQMKKLYTFGVLLLCYFETVVEINEFLPYVFVARYKIGILGQR